MIVEVPNPVAVPTAEAIRVKIQSRITCIIPDYPFGL